jgi:hypothetical protein
MEPGTYIGSKRNRLGTAENLDGLRGLIQDHPAVFAMLQMPLKFSLDDRIKVPIDVV